MLALRCHRRGSLSGLSLDQTADPTPGPGELLIRVRWASVNPIDWKLAMGQFRLLVRGGLPRGVGSDFAGEVVAAGESSNGAAIGARVFGCVDPLTSTLGTLAELVKVPAQAAFDLPDDVPLANAAALSCSGCSAVRMCDLGAVGPGRRVLVNGASGGVGHLAVQLAKRRGATVTAVASGKRKKFIEELGADSFIDYTARPFREWPTGLDVVLDCVPNLPRGAQAALLDRRGRYVRAVPSAASVLLDPLTNRLGSINRSSLMLFPTQAAADELLSACRDGCLRVCIESEYRLAEAVGALQRSMSGRVQGKLLVETS